MRHRKSPPPRTHTKWTLAAMAVAALGGSSAAVAISAPANAPEQPHSTQASTRLSSNQGQRTLSPSRSGARHAAPRPHVEHTAAPAAAPRHRASTPATGTAHSAAVQQQATAPRHASSSSAPAPSGGDTQPQQSSGISVSAGDDGSVTVSTPLGGVSTPALP